MSFANIHSPEIIDKFACACQAVIMTKMLGNIVLFIWSKFKITSNLAAKNLVFLPTIGRNEKDKQAAENSNGGSALLGFAFPHLESLA